MKQKTKKLILISAIVCGLTSLAHAAYPTSYWQIGQAQEVLEFNYGDSNIASNVMAVYPDGSVVVGTFAPSDGTAQGGQALMLDVGSFDETGSQIGGDIGATYYCDENGENCIAPASVGVGDLITITDNSEWPASPVDGDRVFNLDGRVIQTYDGNSGTWEPTYTENMEFYDYDFPLPDSESGDIVWNRDGSAHCCYNGSDWRLCKGNGRCAGSGGGKGSFAFACIGDVAAGGEFRSGEASVGHINIPISSVSPGIVTLVIEDIEDGFFTEREVILQGGETGISIYPLEYDGTSTAGTKTFDIVSKQGTGSCTGAATVEASESTFDFDCSENIVSPVDYILGNVSSGFINIPVLNATPGTATILVEGPEFSAEEQVVFVGGESGVFMDINYNGTGTAGVKEFSVSSIEANGSCVGEATVTDVSADAFTCTTAGSSTETFVVGTSSTGGINFPITDAVDGAAVTLTINQDGFTKTHNTVLDAGQTAIFIPTVAYDGTGTAGTKNLTITSAQSTNSCTADVVVIPDNGSFTCTTPGEASENFILGTASTGGVNLPITNAVDGRTVVLEINSSGFTTTHVETLDAGQTAIFIPTVAYDGTGTAGTKSVEVTSNGATNSCSADIVVETATDDSFTCTTPGLAAENFIVGTASTGGVNLPITNAVDGATVILEIDQDGFTTTHVETLDAGQTAIFIPTVAYDGTGTSGTKSVAITSNGATNSCSADIVVETPTDDSFTCTTPGQASENFVLGTASTGGINLPITNAVDGATVILEIDQDGFTTTHVETLETGQTAIFIPTVAYDGAGTSGTKSIAITSNGATNSCTAELEVLPDDNQFLCTATGQASENFIVGTASTGGINLPIANAVQGETVVLEINQDGFTTTHITTLDAGQTAIFIPTVNYDGSGTAGTINLTINSSQAANACSADVVLTDGVEFDFACSENAVATGDFRFGIPGVGTIPIPIVANQAGTVLLNVDHNGFQATQSFEVTEGAQTLTMNRLNYDGSSGPGIVEFGINSPYADSGCVGEADVALDACPAGARIFSGIRPASELYELPTELEPNQTEAGVDSKNYTDARGPVVLTGVTGNCTADLDCIDGALALSSETCLDCPAGQIGGTTGAALVGINATYDYGAFAISATQGVVDIVTKAEHGQEEISTMTCTADVTCDAVDTVSLSNEYCEVECDTGFAKNDEGVCVPADCDINQIIDGENSGFPYTVITVLGVGEDQVFGGPHVRDNINQCTNVYRLTVECVAPNTWTWSENDPDCGGDDPGPGPGPGGPGGSCQGGEYGCDAGTAGAVNRGTGAAPMWCCPYCTNPIAGACINPWSDRRGKDGDDYTSSWRKNENACQGCAAGACDCQMTATCNAGSWGNFDETCKPCCGEDADGDCGPARSRISSFSYQSGDLPDKMDSVTDYDGGAAGSDATWDCTDGTAYCRNGVAFIKGDSAETCTCMDTTDVSAGGLTWTPGQQASIGANAQDEIDVVSNDTDDIPNGEANFFADLTCNDDGSLTPTKKDCDPETISCDDGYIPDENGGCSCFTNATAFFDGPKIKSITDFLVELFKK